MQFNLYIATAMHVMPNAIHSNSHIFSPLNKERVEEIRSEVKRGRAKVVNNLFPFFGVNLSVTNACGNLAQNSETERIFFRR